MDPYPTIPNFDPGGSPLEVTRNIEGTGTASWEPQPHVEYDPESGSFTESTRIVNRLTDPPTHDGDDWAYYSN